MNISILISSLSTQNSSARMRIWRSIKSCGAATLRDGVYVLPNEQKQRFDPIIDEHQSADGIAYLFDSVSNNNLDLIQLFNRKSEYSEFLLQLNEIESSLNVEQKNEHLKSIRKLRKQLSSLIDIDFFPNELQNTALNAISKLELKIHHLGESNEPSSINSDLPSLNLHDFQSKTWATRKRPWVDRLTCTWLIQKFIDKDPTFIWLQDIKDCPADAYGFDFDGATFTHVGELVSFEVLLHSFNLADKSLLKIAEIVHYLDIGGNEPPEALGLEKILQGLRSSIHADQQLVELSNHIFDGLYTNFKGENS